MNYILMTSYVTMIRVKTVSSFISLTSFVSNAIAMLSASRLVHRYDMKNAVQFSSYQQCIGQTNFGKGIQIY
jgi:hypothetical protein